MADYLLEIGTEEIPAKFMPTALEQLKKFAKERIEERRISFGSIQTMGTPRRMALLVYDIAPREEDVKEEVKGPAKKAAFAPDGSLTKAGEGFARSQGVASNELIIKDTGKGEYVYAMHEVKGKPTKEVLPEIVVQIIGDLSFPKPMRWANKEMRFARPIRWLVSLLDKEIIPVEIEGLRAGNLTRGHRVLGQEKITITEPSRYIKQLEENFVMADQGKRHDECWRQIQEAAKTVGGEVEYDEELLDEVTYLLEWPTAVMGEFDQAYLEMPVEVIITPMREHQRYFPVRNDKGELLNRFITLRNGDDKHLEVVKSGNEKVLRARLADARFFWEEDKKRNLAENLPKLKKVIFQEELGTLAQKTERVKALVESLALLLELPENVRCAAIRAAELAKADLTTNMVYEFPELQGIMGRYYALLSGETEEVALAVKEHYQPRFAGDEIPSEIVGALVGIADKADTVAGCFAAGIEPTGSQDPYALRRQAMGICLTLIGHSLEIDLAGLLKMALSKYQDILSEDKIGEETLAKLMEFFRARVKNILADKGYSFDVSEAVLGVEYGLLTTTLMRAEALSRMKDDECFGEMLTSFTRAYNIAKKARDIEVKPEFLTEPAEKELYHAIVACEGRVAEKKVQQEYEDAIKELSALTGPINAFFDAVMVMAEDDKVRNNRLGLLRRITKLTQEVGDLSKITIS